MVAFKLDGSNDDEEEEEDDDDDDDDDDGQEGDHKHPHPRKLGNVLFAFVNQYVWACTVEAKALM
jgi:ABC-type Zn2+ transport system substrate-binding protein/surface adhesin